jgi:putative ABC transport system ATP-binding protein
MTAAPAVLGCRDLIRRVGNLDVVDGVSLDIAAGASVALVGPSGCGKTTLLHLLGLLDRPDGGRVLVDGRDASSLDAAARARLRLARLGFVFQLGNLLPHLTAQENVALPAWRLGGVRRTAFAAADRLLERFGLAHRATTAAALLSPGESQRAAIARALINRPGVVLADEPTGSLDARSGREVLAALEEVRALGAALLIVTHDAQVAAAAHRCLAMASGALWQDGDP